MYMLEKVLEKSRQRRKIDNRINANCNVEAQLLHGQSNITQQQKPKLKRLDRAQNLGGKPRQHRKREVEWYCDRSEVLLYCPSFSHFILRWARYTVAITSWTLRLPRTLPKRSKNSWIVQSCVVCRRCELAWSQNHWASVVSLEKQDHASPFHC